MLGRKERDQLELLMTGSLLQLVLTFMFSLEWIAYSTSWLQAEVAELYCETNGRPGVDPRLR